MMAHQNALVHRPLASLFTNCSHLYIYCICFWVSIFVDHIVSFLPVLAVPAQNNVKQVGYFGPRSTLNFIYKKFSKRKHYKQILWWALQFNSIGYTAYFQLNSLALKPTFLFLHTCWAHLELFYLYARFTHGTLDFRFLWLSGSLTLMLFF